MNYFNNIAHGFFRFLDMYEQYLTENSLKEYFSKY